MLWLRAMTSDDLLSALDNSKEKKAVPLSDPHYHGHRERLRTRFVQGGESALADYELLELFLFALIPRRDVKSLAKALLTHFGSLSTLATASLSELASAPGLTRSGAITLRSALAIASRAAQKDMEERDVFADWNRLIDYCYAAMAREKREQFRVLYLTRKNTLIADEVEGKGSIDHTPAYPREVIRRALELGAAALILVHNHPSGDPHPSQEDIALTHAVIKMAKSFNITLHDHIIIARTGYVSLKSAGLMENDT